VLGQIGVLVLNHVIKVYKSEQGLLPFNLLMVEILVLLICLKVEFVILIHVRLIFHTHIMVLLIYLGMLTTKISFGMKTLTKATDTGLDKENHFGCVILLHPINLPNEHMRKYIIRALMMMYIVNFSSTQITLEKYT